MSKKTFQINTIFQEAFVKKAALLICMFLVIGMAGNLVAQDMTAGDMVAEAKANILHVNVTVVKDLFDTEEYIFIDVREESETRMGFIPGALLVPRGLIEFRIASLVEDKNAKIVVYCKSGGRSSLATYSLKKLGYTNVISMDGGWTAWESAGYPVDG